ncbi:hypothetical protein AZ468_04695 [Vibrio europaeus]|uniref:Uncharacterized protein n=1 Tax=Vibrio europaeus TaxID=300876 RepID=A0A178JH16_9VIBR|nr:hypothetical protein AZ468_04695 [Vibrio europaeus]
MCDKQFSACNELLLAEIKEYKPRVIIFLTGLNWFNGFLSDHVSLTKNDGHNLVESCGTLLVDGETIKVVVAKHPQGKSESTMVSEIIDVINQ